MRFRWFAERLGEKPRPLFDPAFGAVLPVVCLLLDPIVFRSGMPLLGEALFPRWRAAAFVFVGIEAALLLAGWRPRLRGMRAAFIGCALLVGGLGSLALGVALAPLSLVGALFAGIGLLGLTPLLTAVAYLRNAARLLRRADVRNPGLALACAAGLLAATVPAATAYVVGVRVMDTTIERLNAEAGTVDPAVETLRRYSLLVEFDDLVHAYGESRDEAARSRIADTYRRLTSKGIEQRIGELSD
ncbi:MAG: hypothetical protein ACHQ1G_10055 [Planctomycetota bacterium]